MLDTAADAFGAALTAFDFTGDGRPDLAIGVPYEDIGNEVDAGAINVVIGSSSASGFGRSQAFDQRHSRNLRGGRAVGSLRRRAGALTRGTPVYLPSTSSIPLLPRIPAVSSANVCR